MIIHVYFETALLLSGVPVRLLGKGEGLLIIYGGTLTGFTLHDVDIQKNI